MESLLIGVAGGSGSGKSTLVEQIRKQFSADELCVIQHDNYYRCTDELTMEERSRINYDHPDAYETELLMTHLEMLKRGEAVRMPVYDFSQHNRSKETVEVRPTPVIILEGILLLADRRLLDLLDIRLFVETDPDTRMIRRMRRDVESRGRTVDSVITQYVNTVKPMYEEFVAPARKNADLIIPDGAKNPVVIDLITARIRQQLNK